MRASPAWYLTRFGCLAAGLTLAAAPAPAQSVWQGGSGTSWMAPANWVNNNVPVSSNATALQFNGASNLTANNDFPGTFTLNSMTFGPNAGPYVLTGNPLLFSGTTPALTNASASLITVGNAITFNSSGAINNNLGGTLSLGALTILGATVTVSGDNVVASGITFGSSTAAAAASALDTGTSTLKLGGDLVFNFFDQTLTTPPAQVRGRIDLNGATRNFGGTGASTGSAYDVIIGAVITGAGGVNFPGTASANGNTPFFLLRAANTYTGATTVGGNARVNLGVANALPTTTAVSLTGTGLLSLFTPADPVSGVTEGSFDQTVGSLSGTVGTQVRLGNSTLTVGGDNTTTTFAGNIVQGTGAAGLTTGNLTKVGGGLLVLTGNNSYRGITTVSAGTLLANNPVGTSGTGASRIVVDGPATFGGTGTVVPNTGVAGNNTLVSSGAVAPGFGFGGVGTLTVGSASVPSVVTFTGSGTLAVDVAAGTLSDRLVVNGTLNLQSGSRLLVSGPASGQIYTIAQFTSLVGSFSSLTLPPGYLLQTNATSLQLVPVPEPAALLGASTLAAGAFGWVRRRRAGK